MKATAIAAMFAASFVCGAGAAHKDYLRFTARGGSVTIGMVDYYAGKANPTPPLTLEWTNDPDAEGWLRFDAGLTTLSLGEGETAYLRQYDPERKTVTRSGYAHGWSFRMVSASSSATVEAGGNCLSIIDATCACDAVATNALCYLFSGCAILTTPPELPAKRLAKSCYANMYNGCSALIFPPELPALELDESCYSAMFENCTSLVRAPALPAVKLKGSCYYSMFENCASLESGPHLPATALPMNCYNDMFRNCSRLRRISVAFTAWQTDHSQTAYWLDGTAEKGIFICPTSLTKTYGRGYIPTSWTAAAPVTVTVPRQANCTATATANGAAIAGAATGDAVAFTFAKGQEDADIALEASEGYALVGATEYVIPRIAASVALGSGDYTLPTVVRIAPECPCESAALQFDGLSFENGAITLTLGVKTVTGLGDGGWQRATVSNAALSSDGKAVTLTIPSAGPQAFFSLAK